MKESTTMKCVFISEEEIKNNNFLNTCHLVNRCAELDEQKAKSLGFTDSEYNAFVTRVNKIRKKIQNDGEYSRACPIIIATCKEDGKLYIIDGQGRLAALRTMAWTEKMQSDMVPAMLFTEQLSLEEIAKLIRACNTCNTDWKNKELRHTDAKVEGGELLEAFNLIEKYKENFDNKKMDYLADLMFYGQLASHQRSKGTKLGINDFRPNHKVICDAYLSLVSQCVFDREDTNVRKSANNCNFGIVLESLYAAYERVYRNDVDRLTSALATINNAIIKTTDKLTDKNFVKFFSQFKKADRFEFYKETGLKKTKFKYVEDEEIMFSWLNEDDKKSKVKNNAA